MAWDELTENDFNELEKLVIEEMKRNAINGQIDPKSYLFLLFQKVGNAASSKKENNENK